MKLRWTPEAAENLEAIFIYLIEHKPSWAETTVRRIQREVSALTRYPMLGRRTQRAGVRALSVSLLPYLCIYEIRGEAIVLLHIYHTAQSRPPDLQ